jgi:hypothetical protein
MRARKENAHEMLRPAEIQVLLRLFLQVPVSWLQVQARQEKSPVQDRSMAGHSALIAIIGVRVPVLKQGEEADVADLLVRQPRMHMPGGVQGAGAAVLRLLVGIPLAYPPEAEAPASPGHACLVIMAARRHGKAIAGVRLPEQAQGMPAVIPSPQVTT